MMYERIQLNLEGYGLTKLELQIRIFSLFHNVILAIKWRNFAILLEIPFSSRIHLYSMQVKYIKENTMQIHCRAKLDYHRS